MTRHKSIKQEIESIVAASAPQETYLLLAMIEQALEDLKPLKWVNRPTYIRLADYVEHLENKSSALIWLFSQKESTFSFNFCCAYIDERIKKIIHRFVLEYYLRPYIKSQVIQIKKGIHHETRYFKGKEEKQASFKFN